MNELTPQKLIDNLKEKIKVEFINLVPEKEWDKFIKDTIVEYKRDNLEEDLKVILQGEIKKIVIAYLNDHLGEIWNTKSQRQQLNPELKTLILALAPEILSGMISGSVQYAIEGLKNQIINRY